jgi:hypothetical protein
MRVFRGLINVETSPQIDHNIRPLSWRRQELMTAPNDEKHYAHSEITIKFEVSGQSSSGFDLKRSYQQFFQ